ncbi:unnamed protein product [Rotaria sp. Silwood2]|nr:unnamed protein product [Rotaria sp. Silwood2]CAF3304810.1 unnamed protein product [Rotaria sp. Silwood2]CAF4097737.1 unnamed protein product [Rotaria sp. Silwood2]CAF4276671.1 unnamed protein product [Rotaria sp. Silwood2]
MHPTVIYRSSSPVTTPTYIYVGPHQSSISSGSPYRIFVETNNQSDTVLADTQTIRRELTKIKKDIKELKQKQTSPNYYFIQQDFPNDACPICNTSSKPESSSIYYCDQCHGFVEGRVTPMQPTIRTKTPTTTYQDSYVRVPSSSSGHSHYAIYREQPKTSDKPRNQSVFSPSPALHSRPWIPAASKNAYPNRRWYFHESHPEP